MSLNQNRQLSKKKEEKEIENNTNKRLLVCVQGYSINRGFVLIS